MVGGRSRVLAASLSLLALGSSAGAQRAIVDNIRGFRLGDTVAQMQAHWKARCTELTPSPTNATILLRVCPAENDPTHTTVTEAFNVFAPVATSFAVILSACTKEERDAYLNRMSEQLNFHDLRPLPPDQLRSRMMRDGVFAGFALGEKARYLVSSNTVEGCDGTVYSVGLVAVDVEQAVADQLARDTSATQLPAIPGR